MHKTIEFDDSLQINMQRIYGLLLLLLAGLFVGCPPPSETQSADQIQLAQDRVAASKERSSLLARPGDSIKLFAYSPHYLTYDEPEQFVDGTLSRIAIQKESKTDKRQIRLQTDQGEWRVYSEGISPYLLDAIVDQPLRITGKWVDQKFEGAATEVWIAKVTVPSPSDG